VQYLSIEPSFGRDMPDCYCYNLPGLNLSWSSGSQPEGSNLLRMRNVGLGKSAPLLSSSSVSHNVCFILCLKCEAKLMPVVCMFPYSFDDCYADATVNFYI